MRGVVLALALAAAALPAAAASPWTSWSLRFDLLSPAGISCTAEAPDASVRSGRNWLGQPWITVTGDVSTARILCTGADGSRWQTALPRHRAAPLKTRTEAVALWRPGASRLTLMLPGPASHHRPAPEFHPFTRLR